MPLEKPVQSGILAENVIEFAWSDPHSVVPRPAPRQRVGPFVFEPPINPQGGPRLGALG